MKTLRQNIKHSNPIFFLTIGSIVSGLIHSLEGHHFPPLDFITNKFLPQSSQPLGKVQTIDFET
jgi:hypothetical protein